VEKTVLGYTPQKAQSINKNGPSLLGPNLKSKKRDFSDISAI
jgi:hypothetical protein